MCPDRQILSLYLDGELPSPWKGKMESHLQSCQKCRAVLAGYRNIGANLKNTGHEDVSGETIQAAQDRVWKKITAPQLVISGKNVPPVSNRKRRLGAKKIWNRNVTLPLPAAAAGVVIILFIFLALMGINRSSQPVSQDIIARIVDDQGIVPMQDMNGVLQYLSSQDYDDFTVIRLPESRRFSRVGEPTLINAADYSRRLNPR